VFSYGIIQKFILFPLYLENFSYLSAGENAYLEALIERIKSGRIFSLFRLPTLYAIICAIFILFIFHYFLKSSTGSTWNKSRITWAFLLVLGIINLILTQSFGGIIYLSAGILAYLLLSKILKLKYLAPILMVFCLFFSITIALRFQEARKLEPAALRMSNWSQAARVIDSAPFWGVGLGNYEAVVSHFTRPVEAKSIYAHNFFLQFIAETGAIISFFLVLLLVALRKKLTPPHPRETEKALYISVFIILLSYNLIDIGFYFFPAALAGVVVLSQIYPASEYKKTFKDQKFGISAAAVLMIFLVIIMGMEAFSENYRVEADILHLQKHSYEAQINYQRSLWYNPYNFRALIGFASIKFQEKALVETRKYLERALVIYPDSAAAHFLKSKLELVEGHLGKAFFHASYANEKNRINAEYYNWYLALLKNLKKHLGQDKQGE
jgi:hypothetical protein